MSIEELYPESPYAQGLGEFIKWCPHLTEPKPVIEEHDGKKYIMGYRCRADVGWQRKDRLVEHTTFVWLYSVHEAQVLISELVKFDFHFYLKVTEFEPEEDE